MDDPGTPGFDVGFDSRTGAGLVDAAAPFPDREAAEVAMLAAPQSAVVDPFVVDRKDGRDGREAMTLRNAIRAY